MVAAGRVRWLDPLKLKANATALGEYEVLLIPL